MLSLDPDIAVPTLPGKDSRAAPPFFKFMDEFDWHMAQEGAPEWSDWSFSIKDSPGWVIVRTAGKRISNGFTEYIFAVPVPECLECFLERKSNA